MQIEEFWQLIEKTLEKKHTPYFQKYLMIGRLSRMSTDDIIDFDNIFSYLVIYADLNALGIAANIIGDGCGNDGFWDFRGWLIAQGKDIYCATIQNPETLLNYVSLEKRDETQYEGFIYVGANAHQIKTGEEIDRDTLWDAKPRIQTSVEEINKYPRDTYNYNDEYEKGEAEVYPKLWAKFGKK